MLLLSALSTLALANTPPPIVGGSEVSGHPYKQIGAFVAEKGGFAGSFCSGTLVEARRVITAAHCVEAAEDYEGAGYTLYFAVADEVADPWETYAEIKSMHMHPDYSATTAKHDIAVLYLSTGIQGVGTMSLNTEYFVSSDVGEELVYVGYGLTNSDQANSGGVRRKVSIPLYYYDTDFLYTYADGASKNVCSGDSGGAAIWKDPESDTWELVGVNSFVFDLDGGQPDCDSGKPAAAAVRVDHELDFLEEHVTVERESDADTDADSDTDTDTDTDADSDTAVPQETGVDTGPTGPGEEPASCGGCTQSSGGGAAWGLGLLGLVGLLRRRRR